MSFARPISASDYALLALACGLATVVLCFRLSWQEYWWDEHVTLMFTRMSWPELMIENWGVDTHRPVFYGLQKAWIAIFGESVSAVRSLAIVLMLPLVPIFFFIGRRLGPPPLAALTALLMATAPMFLYQGREVRMYALANLALAVALLLALILAERARKAGNVPATERPPMFGLWAGFASAMAVAFYAQSLGMIVACLFALWILISVGFGHLPLWFLWQSLVAGAGFALLCLPGLYPFFFHASETLGGDFWVPRPTPLLVYYQTTSAYPYPMLIKPVVGLTLLWGLWSLRERPITALLLGIMVFGLPLLVFLISLSKPIYMTRVIAWGSLCSIPLLAVGILALRSQLLRWGVAALVFVGQFVAAWNFYPPAPERFDTRAMASELDEFDPARDVLILADQRLEPEYRWYRPELFKAGEIYAFTHNDWTRNVIDTVFRSTHVVQAEADEIPVAGHRIFKLWQVPHDADSDAILRPEPLNMIGQGRPLERQVLIGQMRLEIYGLD